MRFDINMQRSTTTGVRVTKRARVSGDAVCFGAHIAIRAGHA
jgi:hypothetical protein